MLLFVRPSNRLERARSCRRRLFMPMDGQPMPSRRKPTRWCSSIGTVADWDSPSLTCVNARILLRQDNFDRPFLLFLPTVDHLQGSLLFVLLLAKIDATTPPYGWSPPPGPSVVDGWRRDERTRDRPQSKLECARLVCQAYHRHPGSTTSRPPASTRSLQMPAGQGCSTPGHPGSPRGLRKPRLRQGKIPLTPTFLASSRN